MINTKRIFFSFLIGSVIGSVIALLIAPKKGIHFRNDLSRKTNEFIKESRKKTIGIWNDTKERTENTLGKANDFLNSGKEMIELNSEK